MDAKHVLQENCILSRRYIVQRAVGFGGFGITYQAWDSRMNQSCAIKELFPRDIAYRMQDGRTIATFSESKNKMMQHCRDRFGEEAMLLQSLGNISAVVKIYDFFYENNTCYFVMEFLDGVTLGKLMKSSGGKLELPYVMEVAKQAGEALAEVHKKGIFHRDISPDNIFVTKQGQIKLIDFGNAKHLVKKEGEIHSVVLKKGYAPMEQYSAKGVQGTYTDVYSFAFTLYYALTGVHPPDVFDYQKDGYRKLNTFGFSDALSDGFDRALKISFKERTQTMGGFLRDIGVVSGQSEVIRTGQVQSVPQPMPQPIPQPPQRPVSPPPPPVMAVKRKAPVMDLYMNGIIQGSFRVQANQNIMVGRRAETADFVVDEMHVSSQHCEIFYSDLDNMFCIVDHSTNGTYINGRRAEKNVILPAKAGDQIALGSTCAVIILREA